MVVREGIGRRSLVERSLALTEFGLGRISFGSDWPVCTTAATYAQVKAIVERLVKTQSEIAARFLNSTPSTPISCVNISGKGIKL